MDNNWHDNQRTTRITQQLAMFLCFFVEAVWRMNLTDSLSRVSENGTGKIEQFGTIRMEVRF
ncbi:MAG: hypothetical protein LKI50_06880 [Leuconostoc mesenteroides]|jgi:hypothetical protein|nr:hypothetical protein [Leuconostoc mesenteroides]